MTEQPEKRPPMAMAMEWVSRIFAISLEMVLPGLAGVWLDKRFQTQFLALLGFALGISLAIWHLIVMTSPPKNGPGKSKLGKKQGL